MSVGSEDARANGRLYIVEVDDQCESRLAGHGGCSYTSPPQPEIQALLLVDALLGHRSDELCVDNSPWQAAIAGGRRIIRLHHVDGDGQLLLRPGHIVPETRKRAES